MKAILGLFGSRAIGGPAIHDSCCGVLVKPPIRLERCCHSAEGHKKFTYLGVVSYNPNSRMCIFYPGMMKDFGKWRGRRSGLAFERVGSALLE